MHLQVARPLRRDHSKRNQNKYYQCHKDVDHTIEECVMLKDEIEKLICNRYLQDYIRDRRAKPCSDQNEAKPHREIRTIFGETHFTGTTRGARDHYVREAKDSPLTNIDCLDKRHAKQFKGSIITFSDRDAHHVCHPNCAALVITTMVANNNVYRILVDKRSSVDILYY